MEVMEFWAPRCGVFLKDFCYILLRWRRFTLSQLRPWLLLFNLNSFIMDITETLVQFFTDIITPIVEETVSMITPVGEEQIHRKFISLQRATEEYGPSEKSLYRWAKLGIIKLYKIKGKTMIKCTDIESLFTEVSVGGINLKKYRKNK